MHNKRKRKKIKLKCKKEKKLQRMMKTCIDCNKFNEVICWW